MQMLVFIVASTKIPLTKFISPTIIVGGSSKIQTLCHMTHVLLKLRFTTMERLTGY